MPIAKSPLPRRRVTTAKSAAPAKLAGISSTAVAQATGRTWTEWIAVLDRTDAAKLAHKEIAMLLKRQHRLPSWWSQMITVGFEQAKGRRVVGQTCAGDYSANASRTIPLSVHEVHPWFTDARKRGRWLDRRITVRTATSPKSARLQFADGSIAGAWLTPKGADRCSVGISHDRLPDAKTAAHYKAWWSKALAKLAAVTG